MKDMIYKYRKILLVLLAIIVCVLAYFLSISVYKKEKLAQSSQEVISQDKLYEFDKYPKVDASPTLQGLATAFMENFTRK